MAKKNITPQEKKKLLYEAIECDAIPPVKYRARINLPDDKRMQQRTLWKIEDNENELKKIIEQYKRERKDIVFANDELKNSIHIDWETIIKNIDTLEALDKIIAVAEKLYQELF